MFRFDVSWSPLCFSPRLVPCRPILCTEIPCEPSRLIPSRPVHVSCCRNLPCPIVPCRTVSPLREYTARDPVLPLPCRVVLFRPVLSRPVRSRPVLSRPVLSRAVPRSVNGYACDAATRSCDKQSTPGGGVDILMSGAPVLSGEECRGVIAAAEDHAQVWSRI